MLGKLFKHEFKATGRNFLLMYAVFAVITICNKVILEITVNSAFWSMFQDLFMIAYVLTCAIIFVMTAVLIVTRFYKNMMCDEGYLMFTLPVSVTQHLIVKSVTAFVWNVLSFIVFILSVILLLSGHGILTDMINSLSLDIISKLFDETGKQLVIFAIIIVVDVIFGVFYNTFQIYLSIAIGHLVNKHRVLISIVAYFVLNFVIQNIMSFITLAITFINPTFRYIDSMEDVGQIISYFNGLFSVSLVLTILFGLGYFFATRYILTKKLNLE